jgi:uncharacterized Fe-S center protein
MSGGKPSPVVEQLQARSRYTDQGLLLRLGRFLDEVRLEELIEKAGDLIAIKIDVGELGSLGYLRPPLVRAVVEKVLELGGDPLIMDTTRLNNSAGNIGWDWMAAAKVNGYTTASLERAIVLGDGYTGEEGELLPVDGDELGGVEVARSITECAALIVISHVTGHPFAGLSGALLNFGLGCSAQRGKWRIHAPLKPRVETDKCDGCGLCVDRCIRQAIRLVDGQAQIDEELCRGCAYYCTASCPCDAFAVDGVSALRFQKRVVEAASAVHVAAQGKLRFFNLLLDVVPYPDYYPFSDVAVVPDLGVLSSRDPVAVDQATIDLVDASPGLPGSAAEDCRALDPGPGKLARITGVDPEAMLGYAQDYGLGSRRYDLRGR